MYSIMQPITSVLRLARILANECYKGLLTTWSYRSQLMVQIITMGLIFLGVTFMQGGGRFEIATLPSIMVGYIFWCYARIALVTSSNDMMNEAAAGTLEQMCMCPTALEWLLVGRLIASLITTTIIVALPLIPLLFILHISIPWHWAAIPVILLILSELFALNLLLTAVALVSKQTTALADLIQNALLFLTGSFVAVEHFPVWLATIARICPITQGVILLRSILFQRISLQSALNDHSLLLLVSQACIYLCIGWVFFKWCASYARRQGSLGQY